MLIRSWGAIRCMIDARGGSSVRNHPIAPRRGGPTVSVRGRPAAHTDSGHPARGAWPGLPPHGPAPGARDWPGAPGGGAAEDGASLSHLAYFYDDERGFLSYVSAFAIAGLRNAEPVFVAVPGRKAELL